MKACNVIDKDTKNVCAEPGTVDGACYDHCVLCTVCHTEPAHPETSICVRCAATEAVQSLKDKHDDAYCNRLVLLNAPLVEGQFTPRVDGSIGDLWTGVISVITAHSDKLKIHAWLRDAVTLKNASVGDLITCDLVKGLATTDGRFVEAGYRVVGGTLKISKKEG